jgi:hypothetical protein
MSMAELRSQIQAKKRDREDADIKVFNLAREIRLMIGTSLTPNKQIPFESIADRAMEASKLMQRIEQLQDEIGRARREMEE